jgi:WhiB family redox-sensing transcriptional regulator
MVVSRVRAKHRRQPGGLVTGRGRRRGHAARGRVEEVAALDWQQFGACRRADASWFFSPETESREEKQVRIGKAKRVCEGCVVREFCRAYALENEEEFGVWGGLSEGERKELLAHRRRGEKVH